MFCCPLGDIFVTWKNAPYVRSSLTHTFRARFVVGSVYHLRTTTYEADDELTIHSLVSYLNLAMPVDKHEDFDVREVRDILLGQDDLVVQNDVVRIRSGN